MPFQNRLYNPDAIREITAELRLKLMTPLPDPPLAPTNLSPDEQRLQNIADIIENGEFGCRKDAVRELTAAILMIDALPLPTVEPEAPEPPAREFMLGAIVLFRDTLYLVREVDGDGDAFVFKTDGSTEVLGGLRDTYLKVEDDNWTVASDEQVTQFLKEAGYEIGESEAQEEHEGPTREVEAESQLQPIPAA